MPLITVLPRREGFSAEHFGAVALCVRDFALHSEYRSHSLVLGGVDMPAFEGLDYEPILARPRLWESGTQGYLRGVLAKLRQHQPQLVEVHNRPNYLLWLARRWSGPVSLHLHNDPQTMRGAKTPAQRQKLVNQCRHIYCVSEFVRQRFLTGGVKDPAQKVQVVYNGIDLSALPSLNMPRARRILFVGRLKPEKGVRELAQALVEFLPQHPHWQASFVGAARHTPDDSPALPYESEIRQILAPVAAQVSWEGFCSHEKTMQILSESQIVVMPSLWQEAFGKVALEALACGCSLICSQTGGLPEVAGEMAQYLPSVTKEDIVQQLHKVTALQPSASASHAEAAAAQAAKFEISAMTAQLDALRAQIMRHSG